MCVEAMTLSDIWLNYFSHRNDCTGEASLIQGLDISGQGLLAED